MDSSATDPPSASAVANNTIGATTVPSSLIPEEMAVTIGIKRTRDSGDEDM